MNPISIYYDLLEARKNADIIICITHGGHEGYNLPSPRMQSLYRFSIDCGADVVVNHHQHCYSGYEQYHNGYIFFGTMVLSIGIPSTIIKIKEKCDDKKNKEE